MDASIMTTPPAGAPNVAALVSIRPDVQPAVGLVPECSARSTRWPAPSWNTFEVLLVMVSISPVPKLLPGPVSYFQVPVFTPVPEAPLNSSLQVRVKPAGGAGAAAATAGAAAMPDCPIPDVPAEATAVKPRTVNAAVAAASAVQRRGLDMNLLATRGCTCGRALSRAGYQVRPPESQAYGWVNSSWLRPALGPSRFLLYRRGAAHCGEPA